MLEVVSVSKSYNGKRILDNFSLKIQLGEFIAITGESGKGKTTLLNILSVLEKPDTGDVIVKEYVNPNKKQILDLRQNYFAYLFQNYALIENETVENNLKIALKSAKKTDKKEVMNEALSKVNLYGFLSRKIYELSGGEQQRVALARVFLKKCSYIFADEPTGNLDKKNRDMVFKILKDLNSMGKAIIYVTHDEDLVQQSSNRIVL